MKRTLFAALLIALIGIAPLWSAPVSKEKANAVANAFLSKSTKTNRLSRRSQLKSLTLAHKHRNIHLFRHGDDGFIVIAADDRAYPVLAYSDSGFRDGQLPDNVDYWLGTYSAAIQSAIDSNAVASAEVAEAWTNALDASGSITTVAPLITTRWNQSPYYNALCPLDAESGSRAVTGCVATAMAQIIHYHEHPTRGYGFHSYDYGKFDSITADFDHTTYRYSFMPDQLTDKSSSDTIDAVATLMLHCGVSVQMQYGLDESGAYSLDYGSGNGYSAEAAFRNYFGYDPALRGLRRNDYPYPYGTYWQDTIKAELDAGRPVYYAGQSAAGGHAFVCDGYSTDDFFHFNWGWGGMFDGNFRLDALNPGTGGTGAGDGAYNDNQQIIIGIKPFEALEGNTSSTEPITLKSDIRLKHSSVLYGDTVSVSADVINSGTTPFSGEIGVALLDSRLDLISVLSPKRTSLAPDASLSFTFDICNKELASGYYYISLYRRSDSDDSWSALNASTFRPFCRLRVYAPSDPCNPDFRYYETDFESEPIGWKFAKAKGINTGFVIDTAQHYAGDKGLYLSTDSGVTSGTESSARGYTSIAYKQIYLESGSYSGYMELMADITDTEFIRVDLIKATDGEPLPTDSFINQLPNTSNGIHHITQGSDYWNSYYLGFHINTSGEYYLVVAYHANINSKALDFGVAVDNFWFKKDIPPFGINYKETKEGVLFSWEDLYDKYRIRYYDNCTYSYRYVYDYSENTFLIPYDQLRNAVYGDDAGYFYVYGICPNGNTQYSGSSIYVRTDVFPQDTCPLVPYDINVLETDTGLLLTWSGNSPLYEVRVGSRCDNQYYTRFTNINDTSLFLSYNKSDGLVAGYNYVYVRGICPGDESFPGDSSIWRSYGFNTNGGNGCLKRPTDLYPHNGPDGIELTWSGKAQQYEIECWSIKKQYYCEDITQVADSEKVMFIATDTSYIIPYDALPDTLYKFRVRAICDGDSGLFSDLTQAYNINFGDKYCIPFFDLFGRNTLCTYGSYDYPYSSTGVLDYGCNKRGYSGVSGYPVYDDWTGYDYSRHTIHLVQGETDPRCSDELLTIPPGEKCSMRLGNWDLGGGESVTFTHTIPANEKLVLLLKYAVVLQDPSHNPEQNPHFTLEILDENGIMIDPVCWFADFAADKNAEGWHIAPDDVVWKDWTTIGINLSELTSDGDRTIKIRLTTKDCTLGQHYGYAYFTLSCASGDLYGVECGKRPKEFEVAEGFKYRWYLMDDLTKTSVCSTRVFTVQPTDTNSYHVDMISLENDACFYTLNAYSLPRLPESKAQFKHVPQNCVNKVAVHNDSEVYKIMLDGSHEIDYRVVIDSVVWDFGKYGKSYKYDPDTLIVPNEGDTFTVSLKTVAGGCPHIQYFSVEAPAITDTTIYTSTYMCKDTKLSFGGFEYDSAGVYTVPHKRWTGCDSTEILTITYLEPDTITTIDTICRTDAPYSFHGKDYSTTGVYRHRIPSSLGCDTLVYQLDLTIVESLVVSIDPIDNRNLNDSAFTLPVVVAFGQYRGYDLQFAPEALNAGFENISNDTASGAIEIAIPDDCKPNTYSATITFHNAPCQSVTLPFEFTLISQLPEADASYTVSRRNCQNEIEFTNHSAVYVYSDETTREPDPTAQISGYAWDFGTYGTSTERDPDIVVPFEGDTFIVTLIAAFGSVSDTVSYLMEIPSLHPQEARLNYTICQGDTMTYQGKDYYTEGEWVTSVETSSVGCDSTTYIVIEYHKLVTEERYDTVCYNVLPYSFYDLQCDVAGDYSKTILSTGGCDSLLVNLHLHVHDALSVETLSVAEICSGDLSFDIPYAVSQGTATTVSVRFDDKALQAGFEDFVHDVTQTDAVTVTMPADAIPDRYHVDLDFDNHGCETITLGIDYEVHYASSVIGQRWNDLLTVRNAAYNGGYTFSAYQWYLNDQPIEGHNTTQIYNEGELLDFDGEYRVLLTRLDDGQEVTIISCPFTPVQFNEEDYIKLNTFVHSGEIIEADVSGEAQAVMNSAAGHHIFSLPLDKGLNSLPMPMQPGVYVLKIIYLNGNTDTIKIVVR